MVLYKSQYFFAFCYWGMFIIGQKCPIGTDICVTFVGFCNNLMYDFCCSLSGCMI